MGKVKQGTPPCDGCRCRDDKIKTYREALETVKLTLEASNTGICDTIWVDYFTTLVDVIDQALSRDG